MTGTVFVRPSPGRVVYREDGGVIPDTGESVALTTYYRRRLAERDLIQAERPDPEEADLGAAIVQLVGDPDACTQDGRPKVEALEAILGRDVTAAERDRAWAAHKGGK